MKICIRETISSKKLEVQSAEFFASTEVTSSSDMAKGMGVFQRKMGVPHMDGGN